VHPSKARLETNHSNAVAIKKISIKQKAVDFVYCLLAWKERYDNWLFHFDSSHWLYRAPDSNRDQQRFVPEHNSQPFFN
jgi:hypothetical protein